MNSLLLAIIVSASIDSTQLVIGNQTQLKVEVTHELTAPVITPDFEAQLPDGVERIEKSELKRTDIGEGKERLSQTLTITSFYDTTYTIRPYVVTPSMDTIYADATTLTVILPENLQGKDLQNMDFEPIKDIVSVPMWWWDIFKWFLLGFGIVFLIGISYVCWALFFREKKQKTGSFKPARPADVIALEKLDAIKEAKRWQKGEVKQYQTELTDVVREYIGRRYHVQSTEKTSDETLRELRPILVNGDGLAAKGDGKALYEKLSKMLQLADMVKFAKWQTSPEENEQSLTTAYEFVNTTKEEHAPQEEIQETPTENANGKVDGITKITLVARLARLLIRL